MGSGYTEHPRSGRYTERYPSVPIIDILIAWLAIAFVAALVAPDRRSGTFFRVSRRDRGPLADHDGRTLQRVGVGLRTLGMELQ